MIEIIKNYALYGGTDRESCLSSKERIYIDINDLHELNNTKGHKAGDEMLQYIAEVMRKQFGKHLPHRR